MNSVLINLSDFFNYPLLQYYLCFSYSAEIHRLLNSIEFRIVLGRFASYLDTSDCGTFIKIGWLIFVLPEYISNFLSNHFNESYLVGT